MHIFTTAGRHVLSETYRQWLLLANSGAIAATGLVAAAFGFLFWWFAARFFPPHAVGLAAAAISIMNLIGMVGESGLGTLLVGESLRHGREAPGLISAALLAVLTSSALFGLACLVVDDVSPLRLGRFLNAADYGALFVAGCVVTGFTLVLDAALTGLLQNPLRVYRGVTFSALKLALLPALAFAIPSVPLEVTIFAAWVLGKLLSVLLLAPFLVRHDHAVWTVPDLAALREQAPRALGHYLLDLVTQSPALILPFLVTVIFGAHVNAAFYAAWMMFAVVLLGPASLTMMLFTIGALQPATIAARMRFSLWLCLAASLVAAVGFYFLSGWILSWFGASYAHTGGPVLQILGLAIFAMTLKYHYIAVQRLNGRMVRAAAVLGVGGLLELALAACGGQWGGLTEFTWCWLLALYLEAAFVAPVVLRATRSALSADFQAATDHASRPISFDQQRRPVRSEYVACARRSTIAMPRRRR
jgi:O-antigen/teichoic acid export membrane protein